MNPKNRTLKVYPKHRTSRGLPTVVPEIRLIGKWLRDLGFRQGQTINLALEKNRVTITVESDGK